MYYDVNQNPNIFPASKSYRPQTQIRGDPSLTQMNKHFRDVATQQQNNQSSMFLQQNGSSNLSNSSFVGSRALRSQMSQPKPGSMSYADIQSNYQETGNFIDENQINPEYSDHAQQQFSSGPQFQQYQPNGNASNNARNDASVPVALQINDLAQKQHAPMAYPNVYMPQPFFQLPQKNLIADPDPNYLSIDSQDRDRTKYPNPNQYTIPLVTSDTSAQGSVPGCRYKNIIEIELLSAVIPNTMGMGMNVLDEIYLILEIDEIDNEVFDASNHNLKRGFKLMFCTLDGTNKWLRLDGDISAPLVKRFYPKPKASLDRISIRILKRDGTPFNFGTDLSLPAEVNPLIQNSWTFKITQQITDINSAIGQRNI